MQWKYWNKLFNQLRLNNFNMTGSEKSLFDNS